MRKPSVFVNKIDHQLRNNEIVFTSFRNSKIDSSSDKIKVRKKIRDIFSSPKYVYKADVIIETKDESLEKTIVGMSNNELLTLSNEKIKIDDIVDINLKN